MQLKNDLESRNKLQDVILDYYKERGRSARYFLESKDADGGLSLHFLVDRKRVIKYSIGLDRECWLGAVALGIGPHYFGPAAFWSYDNMKRFSMEATTEAVIHNLKLLDEFWSSQE